MTDIAATTTNSEPIPGLIAVYGLDQAGKSHASTFKGEEAELAQTAAALMNMKMLALGAGHHAEFSIRVPDDFPVRPLRLVVAQMKLPYSYAADGSPAFALRIDNGHWVVTAEHLYKPHDAKQGLYLFNPVGGECAFGVPAFDHQEFDSNLGVIDLQVRAFIAVDEDGLPADVAGREHTCCTTGVRVEHHAPLPRLVAGDGWTDFIVHIRSAADRGKDGIIELFVNGRKIVTAEGEFGHPDTRGDPVQYFKIGLYRNNEVGWGTASLRFNTEISGVGAAWTMFA